LKKAIGILIILCMMIAVPAVALQTGYPGTGDTSSPRVLFLEHYMLANGTVVKGDAPFRSVNFPTYWYNENTGQLNGKIDFPLNSSLKMIFGDVLTLRGNFGSGTGNKLFGVYKLPTYANNDVIYSIDLSGNVIMNVDGKTMALKPGQSYNYTQNETVRDRGAVIEVMYNHTYVNHGMMNKMQLTKGLVAV
jgi:hypothetical protein